MFSAKQQWFAAYPFPNVHVARNACNKNLLSLQSAIPLLYSTAAKILSAFILYTRRELRWNFTASLKSRRQPLFRSRKIFPTSFPSSILSLGLTDLLDVTKQPSLRANEPSLSLYLGYKTSSIWNFISRYSPNIRSPPESYLSTRCENEQSSWFYLRLINFVSKFFFFFLYFHILFLFLEVCKSANRG